MSALLEVDSLSVAYDGVRILWDVSIEIGQGEMVALLGPNGSGKSTLMNALSRIVKPESGRIVFEGQEIQSLPAHQSVEIGIAHVLERHRLFPHMTVLENLLLGAGPRASQERVKAGLEYAHSLFPRLHERHSQSAGSLSGGEQQMCAMARGLMSGPRLLLVDEPFIGLSPQLRSVVEEALLAVNKAGTSVLLIEQNVKEAFRMCARAYVLRTGRVVLSGLSSSFTDGDIIERVFMDREAISV